MAKPAGKKAPDAREGLEDLTYREAAQEIEGILRQIEDEREVDIDQLADRVERASALIDFCFDRLKRAEMRVRTVTEALEEKAGEDS